jgi:hypothetical protein
MAAAVAISNATFTGELHSASWSSAQVEDMCCLVALVEKFAPESDLHRTDNVVRVGTLSLSLWPDVG